MQPADIEDYTKLPYDVRPEADSHYQVQVLLQAKRCIALYDTGAHSTLISKVLAEALGLRIHPYSGPAGGSCKGLEGVAKSFARELRDVRLTLHPLFELTLPSVAVTDSP